MTHILHRAARTAAGAGGFSLLFISDHFDNDQGTYGENDKRNEYGWQILEKFVEHTDLL